VRDPLTGLHNRRYLEQTMKRDISRARRTRESIVVAAIDVDLFKSVNDTHGHAVGDRVLMRLADVLLGHVRSSDLVCRVGGEEFVVVMSGASVAGAMKRAEIWRFSFAESVVDGRDGMPARATISVGIARYRDPQETFAACLKRADEALYEAKRAGRDRVASAEGDSPGNAA
jgi:diguanylate cyclase (GGDEF)-like protein